MSSTACETGILFMAASRRSCSTSTCVCCITDGICNGASECFRWTQWTGVKIYRVKGSVRVLFWHLNFIGERGRNGRECKFQNKAHKTFNIINTSTPVVRVFSWTPLSIPILKCSSVRFWHWYCGWYSEQKSPFELPPWSLIHSPSPSCRDSFYHFLLLIRFSSPFSAASCLWSLTVQSGNHD